MHQPKDILSQINAYMVGGAVRDILLGLSPKDIDWVVVGCRPRKMLSLGFRQVGADFPVFLHPETSEEFALARPERAASAGHQEFAVDVSCVTLEEDLGRRDLTINSMAMKDGVLVDPYGGKADLDKKVLRHTSGAFQEDPLRVLRVGRFLARFGSEWSVAEETLALMRRMVASGELDQLSKERVWKEISRGLMESHPGMMLSFLRDLGVFELASFSDYSGIDFSNLDLLQQTANKGMSLPIRFASVFRKEWVQGEAKNSRIPTDVREVAHCFVKALRLGALRYEDLLPAERVEIIEALDAIRQTTRFNLVVSCVFLHDSKAAASMFHDALKLRSVNYESVAKNCVKASDIPSAIRRVRIEVLGEQRLAA